MNWWKAARAGAAVVCGLGVFVIYVLRAHTPAWVVAAAAVSLIVAIAIHAGLEDE